MGFWQRRQKGSDKNDIFLRDQGMVQLCQGLGMPTALITTFTTAICVPSCFLEVYTDAQAQGHHQPFDDRELIAWFGDRHYADGLFVQRLAEVRDGTRRLDQVDLYALQATIGVLFAHHLVTGEGPFPLVNPRESFPALARVERDTVVFGGHFGQGAYHEQLGRPIKRVLDLDPGLGAVNMMDDYLALARREPAAVFQYVTINRYPFLGHLIMNYLKLRGQQLTGNHDLVKGLVTHELVLSIEGDLAVNAQDLAEAVPGKFDLVLYLSYRASHLAIAQAEPLMRSIYQLLAPGGAVLLGFPLSEVLPGKAAFTDLAEAVLKAGFVEGRTHIGTSNIANERLPVFLFATKP
jgi:SAM-dependent methyltransferase